MTATPMMAQYLAIKAEHEDALLFYRMGDFYELFFDDAVVAAEVLGIALTHRGKHQGQDVPMAGVPVHASEGYLATLIRSGHRVAVCEQSETPEEARRRGSKALVRRGVVRVLTPGTLTEDAHLDAGTHSYLAAFADLRGEGALAWADLSTGALRVALCQPDRLTSEIARINPREVLVIEGAEGIVEAAAREVGAVVSPLSREGFDSTRAARRLPDVFGVASLDAFGGFSRAELSAMGAIAAWLEITQRGAVRLSRPVREAPGSVLRIDAATRRSLELVRGADGGRAGSLLETVDCTRTAGGTRLLERRLAAPSCDLAEITGRLDAVAHLVDETRLREDLRGLLRRVPDVERALSRLSLGRGTPRDLGAVRAGLVAGGEAARFLDGPEMLVRASEVLSSLEPIVEPLRRMLVAELPLTTDGMVADGADEALDEARRLMREGRGLIAALQGRYAEMTGIKALKIKHNAILGYHIEVTAKHAERMRAPPLSDTFVHRQGTVQTARFSTPELSDLESRILGAGEQAAEIERRVFADLCKHVLTHEDAVRAAAGALAEIDVAAALADLAEAEGWCRPALDTSRAFAVEAGRHPVVERALRRQAQGAGFVANNCDLSGPARMWLLTGPNMGGKSTFLRQNALVIVLAQIGSFVPARSARIGLVTQLFSRVGASDDLVRGRSTFMVEMVETAAILHQADARSLVILDEIGRGTATYDGLSIAWAAFEHLHESGARTLFATHYHELTALADRLEGAANATLAVREHEGDVVLLHEVRPGAADRSYGVQVARLAGLPETVTERAAAVLEALERGGEARPTAVVDELPLFSAQPPPAPPRRSEVEARLEAVHPDALSPREALDLLYELRMLMEPQRPRRVG